MYHCIFENEDESQLYWKIIILAISTGFLVMTISLFLFHTYLIFTNLSTCKQIKLSYSLIFLGERLSWNKITYLSDWPKKWGSPFSKGVKENLKVFCYSNQKEFMEWEMPKFKKPLK